LGIAARGGFIPYYAGRFDWIYRRGSTPQRLQHLSVKPVALVQSATKIPEAARQAILGANAARLLGVNV
jgi:hypothetical protein